MLYIRPLEHVLVKKNIDRTLVRMIYYVYSNITENVKLYTILFEQVVMLGDDKLNIFNKLLGVSNYSK